MTRRGGEMVMPGSAWLWNALFSGSMNGGWWSVHNQMVWAGLLLYGAVAGWFDWRERRIPNVWTLAWLLVIFCLQYYFRAAPTALFSFALVAILMLVPTLFGQWGQGDWKMSMVYGMALGVFPTLGLWVFAIVLTKWVSTVHARVGLLAKGGERSIPLATFVSAAAMISYGGLCLISVVVLH